MILIFKQVIALNSVQIQIAGKKLEIFIKKRVPGTDTLFDVIKSFPLKVNPYNQILLLL
jgi:hypothetical protein